MTVGGREPGALAETARLVGVTFVDNAGVTRMKVVPRERLAKAADHGVGISATFAIFAGDDHLAPGGGIDDPTGDIRLVPDLSALRSLPGPPGFAWAPVDQHDQEGHVLATCQRSLLRRLVTDAESALGVTYRSTFEVEFTLLREDNTALHMGPGYSPSALQPAEPFLVDLTDALGRAGIPVEQLHAEYSNGQYEISTGPTDPVASADQYVLLRLLIRRLAMHHGLRASFAPMVFPGAVGNGCHLHLSAWKDGDNLMAGGDGPAGMRDEGAAAIAGALDALPELLAVYAASVPSYVRLQPSHWSGAYSCWGHENREAALRFVQGSKGIRASAANVELKSVDGTANPYTALAVLLGSATAGIRAGAQLPPAVRDDPARLSAEDRRSGGIYRLPESLDAATKRLAGSSLARSILGEPLHDAIVAIRRYESLTYGAMAEPEMIAAHLWRYG